MLAPKLSFKYSVRLVAMAALLVGLGACSGSDSTETAPPTDAETTSDASVVPTTPSVSIVEVNPDDTTPAGGAPRTTAAPAATVSTPASPPQLLQSCKPLANAYDDVKKVWSVVRLTVESKGRIGKTFETSEIAAFKADLASLQTALAKTATASTALATIERGFAVVLEGDRFRDPKAKAAFDEFVKKAPDFVGTQKAVGDDLRKQGCVVIG